MRKSRCEVKQQRELGINSIACYNVNFALQNH